MLLVSKWFRGYGLVLMICAFACVLVLQHAHRREDAGRFARYQAATDRIIKLSLPPGWTAARGFYTARFDDPQGTPRVFAYFTSDNDGRLILVARRLDTPESPPASWDPADPASLAGFKAWLGGITRPGCAG